MKLGLLVRADKTGLGYQTRAFYKHLKPHKTMLIDIQSLNGNQQYYGWYDGAHIVKGFPNKDQLQRFLSGLDVVLTCETPYNYELYTIARAMGVKTVNQYNPEFFDHFTKEIPRPDMLINPSMWKFEEIDLWAKHNKVVHKYIHLPVDREEFRFRLRTTKKTMHVAGKPAKHDRNGTWDYMHAVPNGIVITQSQELAKQIRDRYRHCNVFTNVANPDEMYTYGDILVMPRKYGGNCLPLNEALSTGMPVVMPDVSPNNQFLPPEWLMPARKTGQFTPRTVVDINTVEPHALKNKLDEIMAWDMQAESKKADKIAESISWAKMKDVYLKAFEELL